MADATQIDVDATGPEGRRGRATVAVGALAMLALGGAGFWSTYSGAVSLPMHVVAFWASKGRGGTDAVAFVPIPTLTVTLGPSATARHLRLGATIEAAPGSEDEVERLMPRVLDVLNTYLQAIDERDLDEPAAMMQIRAHLLRRIRMVVGPDRVKDLLVTEFVLD